MQKQLTLNLLFNKIIKSTVLINSSFTAVRVKQLPSIYPYSSSPPSHFTTLASRSSIDLPTSPTVNFNSNTNTNTNSRTKTTRNHLLLAATGITATSIAVFVFTHLLRKNHVNASTAVTITPPYSTTIPLQSKINQAFLPTPENPKGADLADAFAVEINGFPRPVTPAEIIARIHDNAPFYARLLLKLRNLIVKPFGLKTDLGLGDLERTETTNETNQDSSCPLSTQVAEKIRDKLKKSNVLGILEVHRNDDVELLLSLEDTHMDFFFSIFVEKSDGLNQQRVITSTKVRTRNLFGDFYLFFIKPFHKLIVPSSLMGGITSLVESD